jgi:hypothetical protein
MNEKQKCISFLNRNGWKKEDDVYVKNNLVAVDLTDNATIVLLDDTGDFLHIPMNYYSLLGALIDHRQIPVNYLGWK